ncbi:MAG: Holliday junction ATP-dependent DNA helicase RuvA [Candidatus Omnitrophica bacterium]|nr:Holliday junction ATP-dependent DNA helicase RuvA [Candidatus Omnitrophota bacterium]
MIARIQGAIRERGTNFLLLDVGGMTYEVFLPQAVMQRLGETAEPGTVVSLITYHYHQVDPSRSIPVLIGFTNEIEKEFFENFITVSGIGPKAALKALNKPISEIARAIDEADIAFLRSLPGIGQQRAKEIVAKLQNKIGKFGLIKDEAGQKQTLVADSQEEAQAVLLQLGYTKQEAKQMIAKVLEYAPDKQRSTEELLNEVYKQKKAKT